LIAGGLGFIQFGSNLDIIEMAIQPQNTVDANNAYEDMLGASAALRTPTVNSVVDGNALSLVNGATSDPSITMSGTGRSGDIITLYNGSEVLGSVVVGRDGTWTVKPSGPMAPGAYGLYVVETNSSDDTSLPSARSWVTIAPAGAASPVTPVTPVDSHSGNGGALLGAANPVADQVYAKLLGANAALKTPTVTSLVDSHSLPIVDGVTPDRSPIMSGTGKAGDTITLYDGSYALSSVTVAANGKWSIQPSEPMAPGSHGLYVVESNKAGDTSLPSDRSWIIVSIAYAPSPVITNVVNEAGPAQHTIPNNGLTNDSHPTISGTGVPGSNIIVYIDTANTFTTIIVDAKGNWTFTLPAMGDGPHVLSATQYNAAEDRSPTSNTWTITIDTSVPAKPAISGLTDDAGLPIAAGSTTADAHPVISGTAKVGDIVTVYDGATVLGSVKIDASGKWSLKLPDLQTGAHDVYAIDTNAAGTSSAQSAHVVFNIDTGVPAKPVISGLTDDAGASIPAGSSTVNAHPTVSGTAKAGDIVTLYDGATAIGSVKVGTDGKWTIKPSKDLSVGSHDVYAIDTNLAGTSSGQSTHVAFTVTSPVAAPPVIANIVDATSAHTGTVPAGGVTADAQPTISGTGIPGYTIYIYQNGVGCGDTKVLANGTWSLKIPGAMSQGVHDMTTLQFVSSQTASALSNHWSITVDSSTPVKPVISGLTDDAGLAIAAGSTTANVHPNISGTGKAGDIVTVYDGAKVLGSVKVDASGKWTMKTPDLSAGTHDVYAIDTNLAGTSSAQSAHVAFSVDSSTPAKPVITGLTDDAGMAIVAGTTADAHPFMNGTGKAGDIVTMYDGATAIGSVVVKADGTWSLKPTKDLSKGTHDLYVIETNPAGTASPQSSHISIVIADASPTITNIYSSGVQGNVNLTDGATTSNQGLGISGTALTGDVVYLYDQSTIVASVTATGTAGTWGTYYFAYSLTNGAHAYSVTQAGTDKVESAHSSVFHVTGAGIVAVPATPVVSGLLDDAGLAIVAGSTTGDAHPFISGKGTAGDIVTMYDGATAIGSAVVKTDGTWSVKPAKDLSNGKHDLYVIESNSAGNSAQSSHIAITVLAVAAAPVIANIVDATSAHTGTVPAGGVTADAQPTISGTGIPGNTVYIYQNGVGCGDTKVLANGTWSLKIPGAMSVGVHDMTATQFAAGQTASVASNHWSITIDTSTPAKPVISGLTDDAGASIPAGSSTVNAHPTVSGTAKAGDIVTLFDGATAIGSVKAGTDGKWTIKPSKDLSTGSHDVYAIDTNAAGTASAQSTHVAFTVISAFSPPVIANVVDATSAHTGTVPAGGTTTDAQPTISGTGIPGNTVYIYQNGVGCGDTKVLANGTWSLKIPGAMSTGVHDMTATQFAAGQTASASSNHWSITVSSGATVSITNLIDDSAVGGAKVNIGSGGGTADTTPIVQGNVTAALQSGESLVVYRDGNKVGNATVVGTSWSYQDSGVTVGAHTYTARVESTSGTGTFSSPYAFTEWAHAGNVASIQVTNSLTANGLRQLAINGVLPNDNAGNKQLLDVVAYKADGTRGDVIFSGATLPLAQTVWYSESLGKLGAGAYLMFFVVTQTNGVNGPERLVGYLDTNTELNAVYGAALSVNMNLAALPSAFNGLSGAALLKSTYLADTTDHASVSATADTTHTDTNAPATPHETTVGVNGAFTGAIANGNETVNLNADPASYFKQATAHIEGAKGGAVDTLHLTGDHQILDLTSLTGKTAAAKISGIEVIDLGGQHNALKLSLVDVLNLGETDLFQKDGKQQMMVNGKDGDSVDLSNSHVAGLADGEWAQHGTAQVGGVTYNVYEHSGAHTELLVQQGVQIVVH
jgi:hypothetical protein